MLALLQALEATGPATLVRTSTWGYPACEIVHILALGTVFGTLVLVDGLVLLGRDARIASHILPVTLGAFALAAASGAMMFAARATDLGFNRALWLKFALIGLAALNAWLFHRRSRLARPDIVARLQAGLSLAIWIGVVCAGRLIAYL